MTLEERVIAVIRENSEERGVVTPVSDLQKDLGIDSFGRIMIVNGIEDAFSITIDEKDLPAIRTVTDIVTLLRTNYGIYEKDGCSDRS